MEAAFSLALAVLIATEPHSNIDDVKMCAVIFLLSLGWSTACLPADSSLRSWQQRCAKAPTPPSWRKNPATGPAPLVARRTKSAIRLAVRNGQPGWLWICRKCQWGNLAANKLLRYRIWSALNLLLRPLVPYFTSAAISVCAASMAEV